ncbi:MAG: UDP-3-O-(3-hydroxymyristoyl)glucosamine N-acyltransferase [Alphaproteobacteria bacterium]|nr:UDP-3-O-(3-hydroxymyristoyl)glucosamine N-acyltransferase [Alphaproteobacteria bacterium]
MADPRFFPPPAPVALGVLAEKTESQLADQSCHLYQITDVAALDSAGEGHISFLDNVKYKDKFAATKAGACFVREEFLPLAPQGVRCLVSPNPYRSYALAAQLLYPEFKPPQTVVSPQAVVDASAKIGKGCFIEPHVYIGPNVEIGDNCRIRAGASITHALIGSNVHIYPGVRIGQDGFGFAMDRRGFVKVPQLGRVVIGNGVEIGSNSCIDRGALGDTVIGDGTWIDNLVQIGHNVKVGRNCVLIAQCGIAGSTVLEDFVIIAAQAGVAGHLHLAQRARVGAKSGVMRDVGAGEEVLGIPAVPKREFFRQTASLGRLIEREKSSRKPINDQ